MVTYTNNEQSFIAPDLETFGKAMDTLQQRHDEAVKAWTEAQTNIANLDINDVDKDVRAEMLQKVKDLEETFASGSLGSYNINEVLMTTKEVMSNPKFTQALTNQQNFRKVEESIMNNQTLPEDMKVWALARVQNRFEKKYNDDGTVNKEKGIGINAMGIGDKDENGNFKYYEEWKPDWLPVDKKDYTLLYDEMLKLTKNPISTSTITQELEPYINDNGTTTFITIGNSQYQKSEVTYERLKWAFDSAVNSIPGMKKSMYQDYLYMRETGRNIKPACTFEEFKEQMLKDWINDNFDEGIKAAVYKSEAKTNKNKVKQVNTNGANNGGGGSQQSSNDYSTSITGKAEIPTDVTEKGLINSTKSATNKLINEIKSINQKP